MDGSRTMRNMQDERQRPRADRSFGMLATLVVGMAFHWQYLRHANIAGVFSSSASLSLSTAGQPLWLWAFYGSALLGALAAWRICPRLTSALRQPSLTLAWGLVGGAPAMAAALGRTGGGYQNPVLDIAAACLLGISFTALTLGWADACLRLAEADLRTAVLCMCASSLASFAISSALFSLIPFDDVLRAAVPILTAGCLAAEQRGRHAPASTAPASRTVPELPRPLAALNVALLVVVVCVKGVYDSSLPPAADETLYLKHAITSVELVAIMSVGMVAMGLERFAFIGWVMLTGGLVTGCVVLSLADSGLAGQIGLGTIAAARTCLEVFVLILAVMRMRARRDCGLRPVLTMVLVPDMASCLVGYGVLPTAFAPILAGSAPMLRVVTIVLGAGLVLCAFLVMSALALRGLDAAQATEGTGSISDGSVARRAARCRPLDTMHAGADATDNAAMPGEGPFDAPSRIGQLAERCGLTPRECDAASFVYRGYSAKRTAELMHLTLNTVQTHRRNLYRKLGIHSRQELIDLIDQH